MLLASFPSNTHPVPFAGISAASFRCLSSPTTYDFIFMAIYESGNAGDPPLHNFEALWKRTKLFKAPLYTDGVASALCFISNKLLSVELDLLDGLSLYFKRCLAEMSGSADQNCLL